MRLVVVALVCAAALVCPALAHATVRPTVYVTNESTVIPDAVIRDALPVWQRAVSVDFARWWNADAELRFVKALPDPLPPNAWHISVEDNADVYGALAYHGITDDGHPFGRVFAKTCIDYEANWEVAFTHELEEMLADPYIDRAIWTGLRFYYLEVADPVEDDRYAYWRASPSGAPVAVSDFVTPAWYQRGSVGPFDFVGAVSRPFQLMPGGYVSVWRQGMWTQIYARHARLTAL